MAKHTNKSTMQKEHAIRPQLTSSADLGGQVAPAVEDNTFGNEESAEIQYKTCKWWNIGALMLAENVSLGVLALPQALAILGLVLGLLCICFLGIIATYTGYLIDEFKLAHPSVTCYADCGMLIGGPIGREVLAVGQELVLIFIMGAHILTFGVALNAMTDHGACTIIFNVIGLIISFLFGLPRTFKNISYFSYFSGHVAFFSFQSELEDPRDFRKALILEQGIAVTFYMLISVIIYYHAGPSVASPALGSASPLVSKVCFGIALPIIIVAGVVNGSVATKYIYFRVWKGTSVAHANSWLSLGSWSAICTGAWLISCILAEAVPNFALLLSLMGALFGSWFNYALPPLMWLWHNRKNRKLFSSKSQTAFTMLNLFIVILGVLIFGLGMWSSGWALNYGSGSKVFSCENNWHPVSWVVGGTEDA
ncbi:hypothetical protein AA0111_g4258 [Alternaria arborescens]|uniref:hypothetical protein n=1 Tax=Alternaria arborescens TaxID=156630 RepID=UPI001074E20D|nr:hypothetical protein AA0111_g4258 [Alternaria arborescens]RYO32731.1 hypothetical protein AA0111_g4258 [Alternaria arborescens]